MTLTGTSIPQTDPRASYIAYRAEIDSAISRVLTTGRYILGDEVAEFEREFAQFSGVRSAIGVGNGTDALKLALKACGVGPGDIVFTVSHTAVATVAAIELTGATPWLVDIDPVTFTLCPDALEAAIARAGNTKSKAVVAVHLYGNPASLAEIEEITRRHGLVLIEDCAQAHGASLDGKVVGGWGAIGSFSFYPTKNLGAFGDGGIVVTDDDDIAHRVRMLRQYGWAERYVSEIAGENSRLDELQSAILRVKLGFLARDNERRRAIASKYSAALSGTAITLPVERQGAYHVYHQYVVRCSDRDAFREYLSANGVGTLVHYPVPVHLQPAYAGRIDGREHLSATEAAAREIVSLPMFPQLGEEAVERVCSVTLEYLGARPK